MSEPSMKVTVEVTRPDGSILIWTGKATQIVHALGEAADNGLVTTSVTWLGQPTTTATHDLYSDCSPTRSGGRDE